MILFGGGAGQTNNNNNYHHPFNRNQQIKPGKEAKPSKVVQKCLGHLLLDDVFSGLDDPVSDAVQVTNKIKFGCLQNADVEKRKKVCILLIKKLIIYMFSLLKNLKNMRIIFY